MTNYDCTASSADHGNTTYPTLVNNTIPQRIAEDSGEYSKPDPVLTPALKRLEVKAISKTITGQINRLHGLVSLLLPDEQPTDRRGEELRQLAIDLEQATEIIEATVNTLLDTVIEEGTK